MYSFGMFLYELVTGGKRPFEDLRFRHELDAAVMKGRALDPITSCDCPPWPDLADLIAHCLENQPNRRATAEQVTFRFVLYQGIIVMPSVRANAENLSSPQDDSKFLSR